MRNPKQLRKADSAAASSPEHERAPAASVMIRVQTRRRREGIGAAVDGEWTVQVAAAPVEGAANHAVVRLLAAALSLPPSAVSVARGARSTHKRIRIDGLTDAEIEERLIRQASISSSSLAE